jgi:hypothetical protein
MKVLELASKILELLNSSAHTCEEKRAAMHAALAALSIQGDNISL